MNIYMNCQFIYDVNVTFTEIEMSVEILEKILGQLSIVDNKSINRNYLL